VSHSFQTYFGFSGSDLNLDCGLCDHVIMRFASTRLVRFINEFKIVIRIWEFYFCNLYRDSFIIPITEIGMWMLGYHLSQIMGGSHASPIYLFINFLN